MAKPTDADAIAAQNISLARESEDISLQPRTVLAGVKALLSDEKKGFYIIAEDDGIIIGQMMVTVEWSDWRNKQIWWVQSVYVQQEYRKKRVFSRLLQYVKQKARTQNVAFLRLYVHKENKSALIVYERTGWTLDPYLFYHHHL